MHVHFLLLHWLCIFHFLLQLSAVESFFCGDYENSIPHKFLLIKHCQRSNKTVIASSNFSTIGECANYARRNKGLAFNFGTESAARKKACRRHATRSKQKKTKYKFNVIERVNNKKKPFYNCEILECPEFGNFSNIVNDTRYDYYSLYKIKIPVNSTCLPSIGVFAFYQNATNYSKASETCARLGGNLAHITSEIRTNAISSYLNSTKTVNGSKEIAYVGLNETEKNHFVTSAGEPLNCFRYRAWAPGSPQKNRKPSCVTITSERSWKVTNCYRILPFICEIFTTD